VDADGSERSQDVPTDSSMKILMMRTANEEKRIFVNWGVLPADVYKEKKLPKEVKDITVSSEPFVRLGRVAGVVAYAYGTPAPAQGSAPPPGLWIEQDQFTIRKVRTPDGAELNFNDYGSYSKGLVFPKSQIINFDTHTAQIRVTRVSSMELSGESRRQFDLNWLRSRPDARSNWPATPLGAVVQEFFRRFR
jgi:hypothetical protein